MEVALLMIIAKIMLDLRLWKILLGVSLIVFSFIMYRRTLPLLPLYKRILLSCLRVCAFILLILFLLDPTLISTRMYTQKPLVLALLDVSKSMSILDSHGKSRIEEARESLKELRAFLHSLTPARIEVLPFADDVSGEAVSIDSIIKAPGEGTDILGAIRYALQRFRSSHLAAIVLLSDGRVSRGMMTSGVEISVPVYTVGFGDTLERADVSVEEVLYERVAYTGTATTVEAVLRAIGYKGSSIDVRLTEEDEVKDTVTLQVGADIEEIAAQLQYVPRREGDRKLVIEAVTLAGEEITENNTETIRINVLKDKIRFLYIDQFPDWNVTFLRDLVKRSKRFEIETITWVAASGFVVLPGRKQWKFPTTLAELRRYDLIVIADDTRIVSDRSNSELLDSYVRNGGSLLFLADEHSPARYVNSMRAVEQVLPVRLVRSPALELMEYDLSIAPGENDHPLATVFTGGGVVNALPPLLGRIIGLDVTAGARVPLIMHNGEKSYPFLVIQRYGEGLSAFVMGFPIWRWKLARGAVDVYDAFFGALIQYLAEGADVPRLEIEADRTVYRAGERVGLTVYGEHRYLEGVRGEIYRVGENGDFLVGTFLFEPDVRGKGYSRAYLDPIPPGEYRIRVSEAKSTGEVLRGEVPISILPVSVEFLKTSRDAAMLRYIATISGGRMLESSELASLPSHVSLEEAGQERREVKGLRASPILFIGIVLLLGLEWILRKAWGLV